VSAPNAAPKNIRRNRTSARVCPSILSVRPAGRLPCRALPLAHARECVNRLRPWCYVTAAVVTLRSHLLIDFFLFPYSLFSARTPPTKTFEPRATRSRRYIVDAFYSRHQIYDVQGNGTRTRGRP